MLWPLIASMSRVFSVAAVLADAVCGPTAVLALTTVAVAGLILLVVRRTCADRHGGGPSALRIEALSLRRRASRTAYRRLRDPDAAGRPRPRAPCTVAAAA